MQGFSCNLVELRESQVDSCLAPSFFIPLLPSHPVPQGHSSFRHQEDLRIAFLTLFGESIVFSTREDAMSYRKKVSSSSPALPSFSYKFYFR